jgi:hypothetical protein
MRFRAGERFSPFFARRWLGSLGKSGCNPPFPRLRLFFGLLPRRVFSFIFVFLKDFVNDIPIPPLDLTVGAAKAQKLFSCLLRRRSRRTAH